MKYRRSLCIVKELGDAGAGLDLGHSMEGMSGMLNGAIHMTTVIRDASNPEIKAFSESVVREHSAQITQIEAMLKRLG